MDTDKRKWHVDKGIPVALIVSMAGALFLGGIAYQSITGKQEQFADKQTEFAGRLDKFESKVDALSTAIQSGTVPSALMQRRLDDLERERATATAERSQILTTLSQLSARVSENERRMATESMRMRAARER